MLEIEPNATLKNIQQEIVRIRAERGFSTNIMHMMLMLCGEMGELATKIRKIYVDGEPELDLMDKSSLPHELADVFIFLCTIADEAGVDLETAWRSKETINANRTWKKHNAAL